MGTNTPSLAEYREQKTKLDKMAAAARKQLQARFIELLTEAAGIQAEFRENFGSNPDLPATVRAFAVGEKKKTEITQAQKDGLKIGGLRRSYSAALRKGQNARVEELAAQLKALGIDVAAEPVEQKKPAVKADGETLSSSEPI